MKRGISEIVSITLIIAIAVSLAIGFIFWGSGRLSSDSGTAKGFFEKGVNYAYADIDIINASWNSGTSTLYVEIENTGGIDLTWVRLWADTSEIKYLDTFETGAVDTTSSVLDSKPSEVSVSSAEGASDRQNV